MTQPEASKPESAAVELLPCPFCGGKALLRPEIKYSTGEETGEWTVLCPPCDVLPDQSWGQTKAQAIAAWNKRVPAAPIKAVEPIGEPCRLDACPAGLFLHHGSLGFRSEYWTSGKPDAYVVESGEYYWGGTNNANDRSALIVQPVTLATALTALTERVERLEEALREISDLHGEINPCNYDHDDACELNRQFVYAITIADAALKGSSHG